MEKKEKTNILHQIHMLAVATPYLPRHDYHPNFYKHKNQNITVKLSPIYVASKIMFIHFY